MTPGSVAYPFQPQRSVGKTELWIAGVGFPVSQWFSSWRRPVLLSNGSVPFFSLCRAVRGEPTSLCAALSFCRWLFSCPWLAADDVLVDPSWRFRSALSEAELYYGPCSQYETSRKNEVLKVSALSLYKTELAEALFTNTKVKSYWYLPLLESHIHNLAIKRVTAWLNILHRTQPEILFKCCMGNIKSEINYYSCCEVVELKIQDSFAIRLIYYVNLKRGFNSIIVQC